MGALKGWGSSEITAVLHPALALAKSLNNYDAATIVGVMGGNIANLRAQGRIADSLAPAQELLEVAVALGAPDRLIIAHNHAAATYYWMGKFAKGAEHADKVLHLYSDEWRYTPTL